MPFIKKLCVFIIILTSTSACQQPHNNDSFFYVSGNNIIDADGNAVILRGIQLGFGSARGDGELAVGNPDAFNDAMLDYVLLESDFALVKNMGANTVRLSLHTYKDFEDDDNPYTYREDNFLNLDNVIS